MLGSRMEGWLCRALLKYFFPRSVQKLESSISCCIPVIVAKQSTKPLAASHLPRFHRSELRIDDFVFPPLVIALASSCCWFIQPARATTISFIRSIDGV